MSIDKNSLLITEAEPESDIQHWLCHQASLTEKLQFSTGQAEVEVLHLAWGRPSWWDKQVIKIKDSAVYRREILMFSGDLPCWYARTIIPQNCYDLDPAFFGRLKQQSLNHLIFNEPKVKRCQLFHYQIDKHCLEMYWLPEHLITGDEKFWLRYSEFSFMNKASFYLCEILLTHHLRQVQ